MTGRRCARVLASAAAAWLTALALPARPATWHVRAGGSGDAPTIQAALDDAAPADTILLAAGTFVGPGNRDVDYRGKDVVVTSTAGAAAAIVDCQGQGRGFLFSGGEGPSSVLSGITVTGADGFLGGGVHCAPGTSPTIMGCRFIGNHASNGGAVFADFASPAILGNLFLENTASSNGGAVYCGNSSSLVEGNELIGNVAYDGGAVFCQHDPITIRENRIVGNRAEYGGGIYCDAASPLVTGNLISGNIARVGGGVLCSAASPVIEGNTLSGNAASELLGGAVFCDGTSSPRIERCILALSPAGDAIHCLPGALPTVTCSLLWGNAGGDAPCGVAGGENLFVDPQFCGETGGGGNLLLQSDSPCAPENNACGVRIGALPVGCGSVGTERTSWGRIKKRFRD